MFLEIIHNQKVALGCTQHSVASMKPKSINIEGRKKNAQRKVRKIVPELKDEVRKLSAIYENIVKNRELLTEKFKFIEQNLAIDSDLKRFDPVITSTRIYSPEFDIYSQVISPIKRVSA